MTTTIIPISYDQLQREKNKKKDKIYIYIIGGLENRVTAHKSHQQIIPKEVEDSLNSPTGLVPRPDQGLGSS